MIRNGYNVFSQYGEDGIIDFLINSINIKNEGQCCEFERSGQKNSKKLI